MASDLFQTLFLHSLFSNIGIKFAGLHISVSSWQMLFVRCLGQSLLMLPLVWWSRSDIFIQYQFYSLFALLTSPDLFCNPRNSPDLLWPPLIYTELS